MKGNPVMEPSEWKETPSEDLLQSQRIDRKRHRLLSKPVNRLILVLAVPTVISMLVTAFYNLADTFFVGKLDSNAATGAVGLVFPFMAVIQAFGFFFGHGSGNYISRAIGKKEYDKAAKMAATGFFTAFFIGTMLLAFGMLFRAPLARFLGAKTPDLERNTVDYLTFILLGAPFMMTSFVLNNQLRLQGNSMFSMIGLVIGAVINVGLDPLFIFTFKMGIGGAALATMVSQIISFTLLFIACQKSSNVSIHWRNYTLNAEYLGEVAGGGLPSLGRQGLASVATLIMNRIAGGFGTEAIAAIAVVNRITNLSFAVVTGLGQGFQPVCGVNYGAGRYDRVEKAVWFSVWITTAVMVVMGGLLYLFAPSLIRLFRSDPAVVTIGTASLRYQCLAMPLLGWIVIMNMFLQNIRRVIPASILAMARQGLIFIPALFVLSSNYGLLGVELAPAVSDVFSFLTAIPFGYFELKRLRQKKREMPQDSTHR